MENVVVGIDIGTSSVKAIAVNRQGEVVKVGKKELKIFHDQPGYSEQDPNDWVAAAKSCLKQINDYCQREKYVIKGISFTGQMHSLVLLGKNFEPLRKAILWNDTRSSKQCEQIREELGKYVLSNPVLEGFTLTKLLWVKENEPAIWDKAHVFMLPKDFVRYRLTGKVHMEYSDASSTLLLNPKTNDWSRKTGDIFGMKDLYPALVASTDRVGTLSDSIAEELGLSNKIEVFAGGGDNACGAVGAGVMNEDATLCSIGTSGVVLSCEAQEDKTMYHNIHMFKHAKKQMSYAMGVTLAAGDSLSWLQRTIFPDLSFPEIVDLASRSEPGSNGLLFAPYLSGERTPHGDASIRGSFIGLSGMHTQADIARAVLEGITYSLYDSISYLRQTGKSITEIISIGGGAQSQFWLQLQADIFNSTIKSLRNAEGPSMGAAMIAAYGLGWFNSLDECVQQFIEYGETYRPDEERHERYQQFYDVYRDIYQRTKGMTTRLLELARHSKIQS
ncbi:xylulokinase [Staphylococcus sp. SQ8-PEA]|uniref:Xylulose kinase n=1 Tax=Staphylococcus marylandisciuri TaxID=2981529 RepID=A0ABT2QQM7_9STAP|nr:xylulokinase [Staphylococcus marylandisciuri]MCU5746280.1 xylulokinase [Staphylococcus marylandisciuri]